MGLAAGRIGLDPRPRASPIHIHIGPHSAASRAPALRRHHSCETRSVQVVQKSQSIRREGRDQTLRERTVEGQLPRDRVRPSVFCVLSNRGYSSKTGAATAKILAWCRERWISSPKPANRPLLALRPVSVTQACLSSPVSALRKPPNINP